jgi:hypothetical protein
MTEDLGLVPGDERAVPAFELDLPLLVNTFDVIIDGLFVMKSFATLMANFRPVFRVFPSLMVCHKAFVDGGVWALVTNEKFFWFYAMHFKLVTDQTFLRK